jgi:hypothetical protein
MQAWLPPLTALTFTRIQSLVYSASHLLLLIAAGFFFVFV